MIGVEVIQGLSSYIAQTSMFLGPLHLDMLAAPPRHQEVATIQPNLSRSIQWKWSSSTSSVIQYSCHQLIPSPFLALALALSLTHPHPIIMISNLSAESLALTVGRLPRPPSPEMRDQTHALDFRNTVVEVFYGPAPSSCGATHCFHYDEKSTSWALQCPDRDCWGLPRPLGHTSVKV